MKLVKDILKEKSGKEVKFSQGRVYLFVAFLSYVLTLGLLTYKTLECDFAIDTGAPEVIINALQWIIGLLAGYVFGGKGIEALKVVMGNNVKNEIKKPKATLLNEEDVI